MQIKNLKTSFNYLYFPSLENVQTCSNAQYSIAVSEVSKLFFLRRYYTYSFWSWSSPNNDCSWIFWKNWASL